MKHKILLISIGVITVLLLTFTIFFGFLIYGKHRCASITADVRINIRKIHDGELAYFDEEHVRTDGQILSKQFIAAGPTPLHIPGATSKLANWNLESWKALKFDPQKAVYYSYSAVASGIGRDAQFTARAVGDIDEDGRTSLFERVGGGPHFCGPGDLCGGPGLYRVAPCESLNVSAIETLRKLSLFFSSVGPLVGRQETKWHTKNKFAVGIVRKGRREGFWITCEYGKKIKEINYRGGKDLQIQKFKDPIACPVSPAPRPGLAARIFRQVLVTIDHTIDSIFFTKRKGRRRTSPIWRGEYDQTQ